MKGIEIRLQGWIRSKYVPRAMMRLDMNETNTYAIAMSRSMENVQNFMRKFKRCGILDIITVLQNGQRKVRGGFLFAIEKSLLIRDVRIEATTQEKRKKESEREMMKATTLTEIWSSSLSELSFPDGVLKEQAQQEHEDKDLVQKCEDWVRDQTQKMEEDSLLSKELNILSSNKQQQQDNFDTTSRKMSLEEAKEKLKTSYDIFTTQTLKADASTFVTQDLYVARIYYISHHNKISRDNSSGTRLRQDWKIRLNFVIGFVRLYY